MAWTKTRELTQGKDKVEAKLFIGRDGKVYDFWIINADGDHKHAEAMVRQLQAKVGKEPGRDWE